MLVRKIGKGYIPLAIIVNIAGKSMQEDFEPVLERRLHYFLNYIEGVMHVPKAIAPAPADITNSLNGPNAFTNAGTLLEVYSNNPGKSSCI